MTGSCGWNRAENAAPRVTAGDDEKPLAVTTASVAMASPTALQTMSLVRVFMKVSGMADERLMKREWRHTGSWVGRSQGAPRRPAGKAPDDHFSSL